MTFLDAVLAAELGFISAAMTLWLLAALAAWLGRILDRPGPQFCDIDPRCHPAFAWGPDGKGHIGGVTIDMRGR